MNDELMDFLRKLKKLQYDENTDWAPILGDLWSVSPEWTNYSTVDNYWKITEVKMLLQIYASMVCNPEGLSSLDKVFRNIVAMDI